ncbi:hypothetical protein [Ktedonospora formicarum]|uniref:Uncharacterized protein n=1 Tax=Ktedonospora formicarum TaxID=2778364 RepID=A0A8J3MRT8_9CHLR|nr:hypothetical protein [Ktedonospora formicarum]GHO46437.1 hypothetical protein KSX_46000 [Ktedonospora formicarum]
MNSSVDTTKHRALQAHLPQTGPILLAIDTAAEEAELDPMTRLNENGIDLDPIEAAIGARKLFELAKREGVRLTVFGRDNVQ